MVINALTQPQDANVLPRPALEPLSRSQLD
jgi:hypothetical protein